MKIWLVITFAGLVTGLGFPTLARSETSTHSESSPEPTSTPTLEGYDTQILPDRHVIFRLLAPQANDVKVLMGVTSSVNESQGTKTGQMKKNTNGFWTVTLGPFEPNLYEYQFRVDGCTIARNLYIGKGFLQGWLTARMPSPAHRSVRILPPGCRHGSGHP
jgi:hypothetical protein